MSLLVEKNDSEFEDVPYTSVGEYLMLETESPFRHEYVDGVMYAMAGGKREHHIIERNLSGMLYVGLRGHRCTNTSSSMKLRIPKGADDFIFYYPDAMISCDPADEGETDGHAWIERPTVIFEVLSASTRRMDEGKKRDAYLKIATLQAYVRIEQDRAEVAIDIRDGSKWSTESVKDVEGSVRLPFVGFELPLKELYEAVEFHAK